MLALLASLILVSLYWLNDTRFAALHTRRNLARRLAHLEDKLLYVVGFLAVAAGFDFLFRVIHEVVR